MTHPVPVPAQLSEQRPIYLKLTTSSEATYLWVKPAVSIPILDYKPLNHDVGHCFYWEFTTLQFQKKNLKFGMTWK